MVTLKVKDLFFDRPRVLRAVNRARRDVLSRAGAFIMRAARKSLKVAKQKPLGELTDEERRRYKIAVAIAQRKGRKQPRRPLAASKPGEPPRVLYKGSLLRSRLFFSYDPETDSVVIGPEGFRRSRVPAVLEFGGTSTNFAGKQVHIAPRPYMGPAMDKELPKFPELWRNSIRPGV